MKHLILYGIVLTGCGEANFNTNVKAKSKGPQSEDSVGNPFQPQVQNPSPTATHPDTKPENGQLGDDLTPPPQVTDITIPNAEEIMNPDNITAQDTPATISEPENISVMDSDNIAEDTPATPPMEDDQIANNDDLTNDEDLANNDVSMNNDDDLIADNDKKEIPRVENKQLTAGKIQFVTETAGFLNTFGWYKIDKDNNIFDVNVIWSNASQVDGEFGQGPLIPGDTVDLGDIEAGIRLGFFIIADGFNQNNWTQADQPNFLDLSKGKLEFRDSDDYMNSSTATLETAHPYLWYIPNDGSEAYEVQSKTNVEKDYEDINAIYHTAAEEENSLQLNPDNINHIKHKVIEKDKRFSIEIEDLYYSGNDEDFDGDYKDLVFELILEPKTVVESASVE